VLYVSKHNRPLYSCGPDDEEKIPIDSDFSSLGDGLLQVTEQDVVMFVSNALGVFLKYNNKVKVGCCGTSFLPSKVGSTGWSPAQIDPCSTASLLIYTNCYSKHGSKIYGEDYCRVETEKDCFVQCGDYSYVRCGNDSRVVVGKKSTGIVKGRGVVVCGRESTAIAGGKDSTLYIQMDCLFMFTHPLANGVWVNMGVDSVFWPACLFKPNEFYGVCHGFSGAITPFEAESQKPVIPCGHTADGDKTIWTNQKMLDNLATWLRGGT
jgi:hypothetical protein